MSANVHGLLHLPEVVRDLGPLWSHSCFQFEHANGEILKVFHGSQDVDKQVINDSDNFLKIELYYVGCGSGLHFTAA